VLFVGMHERQLDDKGRLALPAPFRAMLGEHCYLAKGKDKCVDVLSAEVFERDAERKMAEVESGTASRSSRRALAGSAALVTFDKQGRMKVEDALRAYADIPLESTVRIVGNFDRVEIWEPSRHQRMEAEGDDELAGDE
jgi:MraZ protein